jgi:hypothetical protein
MQHDDMNDMMKKLATIDIEMAAYAKAMQHAKDEAMFAAMAAHVDELFRERCRAMGLPEAEIARIERESEEATAQQIADEIKKFMMAIERGS